ncbi:MAG: efflux RND transporter periplasmic adaptor subunit, partial [bacterium]|nr:efflux RND transporter periplasmic adaptor subunit [bacterium]
MLNLTKTWRMLHAEASGGLVGKGAFEVTQKDKVLLGAWGFQWEKGLSEYYSGVGLFVRNCLLFSRTKKNEQESTETISDNIVIYSPIGETGALSALWTEADIYYDVGAGIAVGGKVGTFEGRYRVTYFYPDGITPPAELDLTIDCIDRKRELFRVEWY